MTTAAFSKKLNQLRDDLIAQGNRIVDLALRAVESFFERDVQKAAGVVAGDEVIDTVDVQIERASIPLMSMGETDEHEIRFVLTIVKINNELERIGDCAVMIAEHVEACAGMTERVPDTFRVMANSVIGMLRDANLALKDLDPALAERILAYDDTVSRFNTEIVTDALEDTAAGRFTIPFSVCLLAVTKQLERIADHCTNMCEQLIYLERGQVVKHEAKGWTKPQQPKM